jgi:hypothetical protein
MPIKVSCVDCGETFSVKDELAGKRVKCRVCGVPVRVSNEASADADDDDDDDDELPVSRKVAKSKSSAGKKKGKKSAAGGLNATLMIRIGIGVAAALVIGLAALAINGKMENNRRIAEKNKEIEQKNQANAAADGPVMPMHAAGPNGMHAPAPGATAPGMAPATTTPAAAMHGPGPMVPATPATAQPAP